MQTAQFPPIPHSLLCPLLLSSMGQLFIESAISSLASLLIKGNVYRSINKIFTPSQALRTAKT